MADLAERIRQFIDASEAPVTFAEVEALAARDHGGSTRPSPVRHRRHWRALVGVGLVGALAIALLIQLFSAEGPQFAASAALSQAADVAAQRPSTPTPAVGQYLYYEVTQGMMTTTPEPVGVRPTSYLVTESTQTWVAADGHGRQRAVVLKESPTASVGSAFGPGTTVPFAPTGYDLTYPTSTAQGGPLVSGPGGKWYLSYPDSTDAPTDPGALKDYIVRAFNVTGDAPTIFLLAGDNLQAGARPALRSALFRLIQGLPGVKDLGPTKDESGRKGTGVAIEGFGNEYTLVFNPKTSAVLGETVRSLRTENVEGEIIPKGTLMGFKNYGPTGITSSTVTTPAPAR